MKEDNTPTGAARRKKPDTHKRLRLEKAKELKAKGVLKKKKRVLVSVFTLFQRKDSELLGRMENRSTGQ